MPTTARHLPLRSFLRVLLIGLFWLIFTPSDASAASPCGGDGQRACCALDGADACGGSATEVNGCDPGRVEGGSCVCGGLNPFDIASNSHCVQAASCGGEGQRACCGGELIDARSCASGLMEVAGCDPGSGNGCLCGGSANPLSLQSSGICRTPTPCGGKGQRTCLLGERSIDHLLDECTNDGLTVVPGCSGDCLSSDGITLSPATCADLGETMPEPATGATPSASGPSCAVSGYADMHLHLFSELAHGGAVLAGKAYDAEGGIRAALAPDFTSVKNLEKKDGSDLGAPALCPDLEGIDCSKDFFHGDHDILAGDSVGAGTKDGAKSNFGAPIFNGWPKWTSTSHQQSYFKWLERAWQGGLRLTTMLAVTNEALCRSGKRVDGTDCRDSMAPIDQQIAAAKQFESYVATHHGGWFKIVYTPAEARQAIAEGKLAVVLGIEVAELFNCKFPIAQCTTAPVPVVVGSVPVGVDNGFITSCTFQEDTNSVDYPQTIDGVTYDTCTPDFIRAAVQKYEAMGVRHIFPVHNFDNAFGAAATWQNAIQIGNRAVEEHWWETRDCGDEGYGFAVGEFIDAYAAVFIGLVGFGDLFAPPFTAAEATCHTRGLFALGDDLITALMDSHMIIDVDHMSARGFDATLDLAEARNYPVVASHVQSFDRHVQEIRHERMRTKHQLERIRDVGGMVAAMLKDDVQDTDNKGKKKQIGYTPAGSAGVADDCRHSSKSFAQQYMYAVDTMQGPVAMGSDFNGTAGHVGPRFGSEACGGWPEATTDDPFPAEVPDRKAERAKQYQYGNRLQYPFTIDGFGTFDRQVTGQKTFDYNRDGMAHIGLLPDFVADLKAAGMSDVYLNSLFQSAEQYIRVWEKARGETPAAIAPACAPIGSIRAATAPFVRGNTIQFSQVDLPSSPDGSYTWSFGDGATGTGAQTSHVYANPGPYTVSLTVNRSAYAQATLDLVVEDYAAPTVEIQGPTSSAVGRTEKYFIVARNYDGTPSSISNRSCGEVGEQVSTGVEAGVPFMTCRFTNAFATNHVQATAFDGGGRVTTGTLTVNVVDATPPVVGVPDPITAEASSAAGAVVTFGATALDDVDGALVATCTPASGSTFPLGLPTTVTCSATDAAGNTGSASFTVTVLDRTPPDVTAIDVLAEATSPAGAVVGFGAIASDRVDGVVAVSCARVSPALFALGSTSFLCSATDAAGNTGTDTLTVLVQDLTRPTLVVADVTIAAPGPRGVPVVLPVTATDLVDTAVTITCDPASSSVFAPGPTVVSCVATDDYGNASQATLTVTVTPPATACFIVDFREITYFKNGDVLTSSDDGIRLANGIAGPFDPALWPYSPTAGARFTQSRGTLFRIYGFKPDQLGQLVHDADDPAVTYPVLRDDDVAGGAFYADLGRPARVSVCPEQLHNYALAGNKGEGALPGTAALPAAQGNVAGVMLTHNRQVLPLPARVQQEMTDLGLARGRRGLIDYVGFQLQGSDSARYREFVDVEISFPWDSETDRVEHFRRGFHTGVNTDFDSYAGCGYVDKTPGNDAVRLRDLWGPASVEKRASASWPACGSKEPRANQKRRADYDVPFNAIQLLPTAAEGAETTRLFFGEIMPVPDRAALVP